MIEDEKIVELFFRRSELAIRELDNKYGKVCHKLSYNIVNNRQDAEECVNDAYLGAWNTIPPEKPDPLLMLIDKETRGREIRWKKPTLPVNDREKWRNRAVCKRKEMQLNKKSAESGCQSLSALFCC